MTPLERARAARHPSTYRSGVSAQFPPCDATPEGTGLAAADPVPAPTAFDFFHATVADLESLETRLRLLKGGKA